MKSYQGFAELRSVSDYWEKLNFEDPIIIYLDDQLKLEFGKSIKVPELAEKIMKFWKVELIKRSLI